MKWYLFVFSALLGLSHSVSSYANDDAQVEIGIRMEYIEVDHSAVTQMLRQPSGLADATALRMGLWKLIEEEKAELVDTSYIVTRSGQRAKIESIREVIYPTEYDPAEVPQKVFGPVTDGDKISSSASPTAMEVRNVGHTLEVDPVIGADMKTVELNIAPEMVSYLGTKSYGKDRSKVEQPVFSTTKTSSALSIADGTWALLGVHAAPPKDIDSEPLVDRRIVSLVRVDLIRATKLGAKNKGAKK
jgi:hypothetical protein